MRLPSASKFIAATWLACAATAFSPVHAAPFDLVTPAEMQQELLARPKNWEEQAPTTRARALIPNEPAKLVIRLVSPDEGAPLPAPLRIELAFSAAPGARVLPASFRVLYGAMKLDLTERLRSLAQISESGVVVSQANLPPGLHRLFAQVSDDQGNVAQRELLLRVGKPS